jgi:uncharacterized protein YegP (UPF0339 family)
VLRFEIVENTEIGKWHARIRSDNNKIVFATQLYKEKQSAIDACKDVKLDADAADIKELPAKHGEDEETRRLRKKMKP